MPEKLDSCVEKLIAKGHSKDSAWAICQSVFKDNIKFHDKIQYKDRKCVSVRDGVQEYYGAELGIEPADAVLKIYRSPETIRQAAEAMAGIPITLNHVDVDSEPPRSGGMVKTSKVIDYALADTDTTLAVQNELDLHDSLDQSGSREFSLGYKAQLIPHDKYDFEQVGIVPHHLALVERGRCGPTCSFSDQSKNKGNIMDRLKRLFQSFKDGKLNFGDADSGMNMQAIIETISALPEVIKQVPMDKLQELMPAIQELVQASKEAGLESGESDQEQDNADGSDNTDESDGSDDSTASDDNQDQTSPVKNNVPMQDSKAFKDAVAAATAGAVKKHGMVMEKAKSFLDDSYSFAGKSTSQIMRDAIATQHGSEQFKDSELDLAFKMLKKDTSLANFGDSKINKWDELKDKEL